MPNPETPPSTLGDIALPLRDTKSSSVHQNTGTSPPTRKPSQGTGPARPWQADSTIKRNYDPPACRKETPNTVN